MTDAPDVTPEQTQPEVELPDIGLWKWYNEPPTADVVMERLASLRPQFGGVEIKHFAEYVLPYPQQETVKVLQPGKRDVLVDHKVTTWVLYMQVAGRNLMKEAAVEANGWRIDLRPDPDCGPGLPPGYIELTPGSDGRIVYRMRMEVFERITRGEQVVYPGPPVVGLEKVPDWLSMGVRYGQAWVPYAGGAQAKRTSPYEKVETAAVGRALGMWGIGVLPGSGVASLEEMLSVRDALAGGLTRQDEEAAPRDREQAMQALRAVLEELRQLRNISEEDFRPGLANYVADTLGNRDAVEKATGAILYRKLSDGQITLMINNFRRLLREAKIDAGMGSQEENV